MTNILASIQQRIKRILWLFSKVNLIKSLYWNFRLFPFKIARQLPIYLGYNVDMINIRRGNIVLHYKDYQKGSIKIGISEYPTFPGKNVHTMLRCQGNSKIVFGKQVRIDKGCSIVATYDSTIKFGDDIYMNMHTLVYGNGEIVIGNHVRIGWYCQVYDTSVHLMVNIDTGIVKDPRRPIKISNNVWVANHATIGPGAQIPCFTTVAACSMVNKDFITGGCHEGGVLVGVPAQYKPAGTVRILNEAVEGKIKNEIFNDFKLKYVTVGEIGLSQYPLDAKDNLLFRTE